jgi:hypothetical protein
MTAAFYPELCDPSKAVRLYRPVCTNGAPAVSRVRMPIRRRSILRTWRVSAVPGAGTVVPNSGLLTNGIQADGRDNNGSYYDYTNRSGDPVSAWPGTRGTARKRFARQAFYDFPRGGNSAFIGVPPVSYNQVVNNLTMDPLPVLDGRVTDVLPESGGCSLRHSTEIAFAADVEVNVAYQRHRFRTTAEIAYVATSRNDRRT